MKAERMKTAWDWLRMCADPLLLTDFRHKDGFQMYAWREWRLDCLLQGFALAPGRKVRSIGMSRARAKAYRRRKGK